MRKTLLARSSPTRVTDEVSIIDLPTDGSLPDGAFNDDHLGTLDAVRGAVHPISRGGGRTSRTRDFGQSKPRSGTAKSSHSSRSGGRVKAAPERTLAIGQNLAAIRKCQGATVPIRARFQTVEDR